jgi:hypothetical protein
MEKDFVDRSHSSISNAEDEKIGPGSVENHQARDPAFRAIRSPRETQAKTLSLQQTRSHRSYGGEDGYSCHRGSEEGAQDASGSEFVVRFAGDSDPDSPRSRSKFRKWVVVIIMAGSALNVYAHGIHHAVRS